MIRAQKDGSLTMKEGSGAAVLPTTGSRSWLGLRDPRIVRVSRATGGKDRHSKVCTVKGLRDRRVRLSIHTAIELYELQDKLGLNQPSKVVDWLLSAAQHEINKLPPLQPPPNFPSFLRGVTQPESSVGFDLYKGCNGDDEQTKHGDDSNNSADMEGYLSHLLSCQQGRLVQQSLMVQSRINYPLNHATNAVDASTNGGLLKGLDHFSKEYAGHWKL